MRSQMEHPGTPDSLGDLDNDPPTMRVCVYLSNETTGKS